MKPFRLALPLIAVLLLVPASGASAKRANQHLGDRTPLQQGDRGRDVRVLQDFLTRAGHPVRIDGRFGRGTVRAVRAFERAERRRVDGRITKGDIRALQIALAGSGGMRAQIAPPKPATTPGAKAKLTSDGLAVAPADAPDVVKKVIAAGNEIAKAPYRYGGGHGSWKDSGYDCSGSVSYALHGGGLLDSPMASGGFTSWAAAGRGKWITTFANGGHMYMTVAGLRFDTSGAKANGNRWQREMRSSSGYSVRHPAGL